MSRRKKKPNAAQRKQDEIQRRIQAAENKKASPPKQAGKPDGKNQAGKPDGKNQAVPNAPEAIKNQAKKPARAVRRRGYDKQDHTPAASILRFNPVGDSDGSQCCDYHVTSVVKLDIKALFDAIRKERPGETGVIYISTNLAEASPSNYSLSYDYSAGLFTRREALTGRKAAKNPTLMADILDRPIIKIRANGGWGQMAWYVNLAPDYHNADGPETKGDEDIHADT